MIYLDNSATTRTLPEAAEAAMAAMTGDFFNPAAAYAYGARTEKRVNEARTVIARPLKAKREEIIFTSGGTESNNAAIFGSLKGWRGPKRVITTAVEHPSVFEAVQSLQQSGDVDIVILPVNEQGYPDMNALRDALSEDTALVSMMHVNNELGTVTDLASVARLIRRYAPRTIFHADGVQAYMKVDTVNLGVDLYSISAHKFHAPKGVGALYKRTGVRFAGGQIGGGQENNLRSGTLNVPGILGMERAVMIYEQNLSAWRQSMRACKRRLYEDLMTIPDVVLNGPSLDEAAPHILNLSFLGVRGEVLLHALEQFDVCVSTGSACAARKAGKNRILTAAGIIGPRQEGAIRFSLCPFNTLEEMDRAAQIVSEQVKFLRKYRRR
ncbi:MAG: cysteine desulfurase [Clostridia bacterium]|nr:cysteine desulfurase [Clostridia bacterium]